MFEISIWLEKSRVINIQSDGFDSGQVGVTMQVRGPCAPCPAAPLGTLARLPPPRLAAFALEAGGHPAVIVSVSSGSHVGSILAASGFGRGWLGVACPHCPVGSW